MPIIAVSIDRAVSQSIVPQTCTGPVSRYPWVLWRSDMRSGAGFTTHDDCYWGSVSVGGYCSSFAMVAHMQQRRTMLLDGRRIAPKLYTNEGTNNIMRGLRARHFLGTSLRVLQREVVLISMTLHWVGRFAANRLWESSKVQYIQLKGG